VPKTLGNSPALWARKEKKKPKDGANINPLYIKGRKEDEKKKQLSDLSENRL